MIPDGLRWLADRLVRLKYLKAPTRADGHHDDDHDHGQTTESENDDVPRPFAYAYTASAVVGMAMGLIAYHVMMRIMRRLP
jgi:hypothetical protein